MWAFTRTLDGSYALAAELVVSAKTSNPLGYRYGPYRIWGDLKCSRYFVVGGQPDVTPLIRSLHVKLEVMCSGALSKAALRCGGLPGPTTPCSSSMPDHCPQSRGRGCCQRSVWRRFSCPVTRRGSRGCCETSPQA